MMEYADNLEQLYVNLNQVGTLKAQSEGADFYVPMYEHKLRRLKVALMLDKGNKDCFYIYGQPGSGKSTALNYFDDAALRVSYELILLKGRDLFDLQDVDTIDILLMLAMELLKGLEKKDLFKDTIERLYEQHANRTEYVQEEVRNEGAAVRANAGLSLTLDRLLKLFGFGVETRLEADYHLEAETRQLCRRFFNISKVDFLATINKMLKQYSDEHNGKQVLVIWDDLEKIKNSQQIHEIFIDNRSYLVDLECKKIIITPVSVAFDPDFIHPDAKEYFLGLKTKDQNLHAPGTDLEKDCELLRQIAFKRVNNRALYGEGVLEMAIRYSGGNIRQFVRLLGSACLTAYMNDGTCISEADVETAVSLLKKNMQPVLMGNHSLLKLLDSIRKNQYGYQDSNDVLSLSLSSLFVFMCQNGDWWSIVNPLIENAIDLYLHD